MSKTKTVLSEVNGYKLIEDNGFYYIVDVSCEVLDYTFVSGTAKEVMDELNRWRNELDYNNEFMLQIENEFIKVLENVA